MKNIKIVLQSFFIIALLFIGCTDVQEEPKGVLAPQTYFSTQGDLDAAVTATYRPLLTWVSNTQVAVPSMGGDDLTTSPGGNKQDFREFDSFSYTAGNGWLKQWTWDPLYKAIYNSNAVINNFELITDSQARNEAAAQAYFVRGIAYFHLARIWGDVPLITNEPATGKEFRTPVGQIYDQVISDLKWAEENLPHSWPNAPGRATKWAAKAYLSKVYLTNAGWPLKDESKYAMAAEKAKEVLESGAYNLLDDYADLWLVENNNNPESVFAVQFCAQCSEWTYGLWWSAFSTAPEAEEGGWDDFFSEITYYKEFPDGPRKDATFHTTFNNGVDWEDSVQGNPYFSKWRDSGSPDLSGTSQNIYLIRFAEVALIYAEAQNKASGANNEAYEWLNKIRRRAAGLPVNEVDANDYADLSSGDFQKTVLDEKKWELGGEWERWYDLVRNEMVVEGNANRNPNDNPFIKPPTEGPETYLAPIPQTEIDLNPNLTQNPCCN